MQFIFPKPFFLLAGLVHGFVLFGDIVDTCVAVFSGEIASEVSALVHGVPARDDVEASKRINSAYN